MQDLETKIKEYTADGSPGVGQLIELGDIAKSQGVKKAELEKMIREAIESNKQQKETKIEEERPMDVEVPFSKENPYADFSRPDLEKEREAFEKEMQLRKSLENDKLVENTIEFNQPEIVFPETIVDFTVKDDVTNELFEEPFVEEEIIQEEETSTFISEVEKPKIQEKEQVFPETPVMEPSPVSSFTFTEDKIEVPTFQNNPESFTYETKNEKDDILRKIIEENKQMKLKAEEIAKEQMKQRPQQPKQSKQQSKPQQTTQKTEKTVQGLVTAQEARQVRTVAIIGVIAAFIFSLIGVGIGYYVQSQAKAKKEAIAENPHLYGDEIKQGVNLAYILSFVAIVVGGLRFLTWMSHLF